MLPSILIPGQQFLSFIANAAGLNAIGFPLAFTQDLVSETLTSTVTEISFGTLATYPASTVGPVTFQGTLTLIGGKINAITDALSQKYAEPLAVPAPDPFLGAAAFLGFSRKLRSRIKHSD